MDAKMGFLPIILIAGLFLMIGMLIAPKYIVNSDSTNNQIYVNGKAEQKVLPNDAVIVIDITNKAKTADLAMKLNNEKFDLINSMFNELLKDYNDLKLETTSFSVNPDYEWNKETEKNVMIGYIANQSLKLTIPDFNSKNALLLNSISDLVKINSVSVPNLYFELSDSLKETTKKTLVSEAMKDSWNKAKAIADAGYLVLNSNPKEIHLNYNDYSYPVYYKGLSATYDSVERAQNNTITPDEMTLSVTVDTVYTYK